MANKPRDVADRMAFQKESQEAFSPQTFTLPLPEARQKAREILNQHSEGGYTTTVQNWRQLSDGSIEFMMCRQRSLD